MIARLVLYDFPVATLLVKCQFYFNYAATKKYNLKEYKYIDFYYSKQGDRLGFNIFKEKSHNRMLRLYNPKDNRRKVGIRVSAMRFMKEHNLNPRDRREFLIDYSERWGMFMLRRFFSDMLVKKHCKYQPFVFSPTPICVDSYCNDGSKTNVRT